MNFGLNHYGRAERTEDFNSKIMLIAIFSLCFVILLVIILHIYARYFLRHPRRNTALTFIYRDLSQQHATEPMTAKSGLDPTVISLLPSFQFKQMEGHDDNIECAVCLSMLEEDESARRLPNCNHVFHMECIDRWLTSQSTCPICRSEASPRLAPLDREPPKGDVQLTEVVVVTSENEHEHEHGHDMQIVTNSSCNDCNNDSKTSNGNSPSSSASFRMSSFRKIIGRDRSSSFNRVQVSGEIDASRQVRQQSQAI